MATKNNNRRARVSKNALNGPAGLRAGKLPEARAIQTSAHKGSRSGAAMPLGIWSRGCYWIETTEKTDTYKYGTYWKRVSCYA